MGALLDLTAVADAPYSETSPVPFWHCVVPVSVTCVTFIPRAWARLSNALTSPDAYAVASSMLYTDFRWRTLFMKSASAGPWALSSATTRKKLCQPCWASSGAVAEGLTVARSACEKNGSAALVAPEKAGPTTATTEGSPTSSWAVVGDWLAEPWSSAALNASLKGSLPKVLPALAWLMASSTEYCILRPSCALPPESGPSYAIVNVGMDAAPAGTAVALRPSDTTATTAGTASFISDLGIGLLLVL